MTATSSSHGSNIPSFLAEDIHLEAKIYCTGSLKIDADFQGVLQGEQEITIGSEARIKGTVYGETLCIAGLVSGDLFAQKKLELLSSANFDGTLHAPPGTLLIHKGASLKGKCDAASMPLLPLSE